MVVLKNDYSHCPLKKRPLSVCYENAGGEQTEPQDLSLKCGKEAPLIHRLEPPFVPEAFSQVAQIRNICVETSCGSDFANQQRTVSTDQEGENAVASNSKSVILTHKSRANHSETENGHVQSTPPSEGSSLQNAPVEDSLVQMKFSHVIKMNDSCKQGNKRLYSDSLVLTDNSQNARSSNHEVHDVPKLSHRRKEYPASQMACTSRNGSSPEGKKVRSDRLHPLDTSEMPTCSQSHSHVGSLLGMDIPSLRVPPPPSDHLNRLKVPISAGQQGASSHSDIVLFTPHDSRISSVKCTSPIPSAPHRPWLSEGPQKHSSKPHPNSEKNPYVQTSPPRSFLAGPPGFWTGMVPFSWPMPPILANPQPPSPRRLHQRECYSPGSESASSDGSSSSVRSDARYSCTECNKSYSTYSGLSKHKQFHCSALGAKSFGCKHCDKVYTSLGALKMHIRTHTLPCKCPLCGKAFSRPWLLQGHIRTHTGEKPFQCPQCDRCFADRSNLRAHLQTHADIKKYACGTCHKTFSRMSLLNKHTEAACPAMQRRPVQ
ncbi:protein snail-like [Macrobrachium rosenbergii]|uniref:protein snail-like n=1 Tax=Macrobrachium rosenbergii TaxID=79674 RepID=UPI0034D7322F